MINTNYYFNMPQEVAEKSIGTRKKRGNNHIDSSALANIKRPSDWSKKTNSKKREPEQDLTTDVSAKCVKTNNNGAKKVVGRLDDDHLGTAPLLLLGLMYWEASCAIEVDPGAATNVSVHLSELPFGVKELNKIESMLGKICLASSS
jgi:hypothetical protein